MVKMNVFVPSAYLIQGYKKVHVLSKVNAYGANLLFFFCVFEEKWEYRKLCCQRNNVELPNNKEPSVALLLMCEGTFWLP